MLRKVFNFQKESPLAKVPENVLFFHILNSDKKALSALNQTCKLFYNPTAKKLASIKFERIIDLLEKKIIHLEKKMLWNEKITYNSKLNKYTFYTRQSDPWYTEKNKEFNHYAKAARELLQKISQADKTLISNYSTRISDLTIRFEALGKTKETNNKRNHTVPHRK